MPRFLNQQSIPMSIRRPHLERFRRQLKEALHNPALAPEQREGILLKLVKLGQPKVYGPSPASAASAVQPESLPDADALNNMTKAQIEAQALSEGIEGVSSSSQTKAQMVETLLANRG